MLLSTVTNAIGIHGLIHLGVKGQYNFNPYNWFKAKRLIKRSD